jgi:hypothetical protein
MSFLLLQRMSFSTVVAPIEVGLGPSTVEMLFLFLLAKESVRVVLLG